MRLWVKARSNAAILASLHAIQHRFQLSATAAPALTVVHSDMSFVGQPCHFKFSPSFIGGTSTFVIDRPSHNSTAVKQMLNRN